MPGFLWTVGLTGEIKLYAFLNSSGVANHNVNEQHQTKEFNKQNKVCPVNICTFHSRAMQNNRALKIRLREGQDGKGSGRGGSKTQVMVHCFTCTETTLTHF